MRTLLVTALFALFAPAALADAWVVWPDADPELIQKARAAAAKLVDLGDEAAAQATFEQTRQLAGECTFGDESCLRNLMGLSGIPRLVWVQAKGSGVRGIALDPGSARNIDQADGSVPALMVRLLAPARYVGTLVVEGVPEGAAIHVGGEASSAARRELAPGTYAVKVVAEGFRTFEAEATVEFGAEARIVAKLQPKGGDVLPPPDDPPPEDPPEGMGAMGISGIALASIGAASAVLMLAYGLAAAPVGGELGPLGIRTDNGDSDVNQSAGVYGAIGAGAIALIGGGLVGVELLGGD